MIGLTRSLFRGRSVPISSLNPFRSISSSSFASRVSSSSSSINVPLSAAFGLTATVLFGSFSLYSIKNAMAAPSIDAVDAEVKKESSFEADAGNDDMILPEKSERRYIHPENPSVNYYSSDALSDALSGSFPSPPILLFVTEHGCSACGRMKPVIKQLSESIGAAGMDDKIIIGLMDGDRNYKKDFFTQEEAMAVPRIKLFFPADKASNKPWKAFPYDGRYNSKAIAEWVQTQLSENNKNNKFSLDKLLTEITSRDSDTTKSVQEAARESLDKDITSILFNKSPCGKETLNYIVTLMSRSYASTQNDLINDKTLETLFNSMQSCLENKHQQNKKYWQMIAETAKDNLEGLEERKKNKKDNNNKKEQKK